LILASAAFAAMLVGCVWFILSPLDTGGSEGGPSTGPKASALPEAPEAGPLASYASIYTRPLRKPLYDPTPTAVIAAAKAEPKFPGVLTGTIVEPGFTFATFRVPGGDEKVVPVGQVVEGAEVLAITQGEVRIRFNDKEITLKAAVEAAP
jgi:hypothetical protein